jgi:hypothetical protein
MPMPEGTRFRFKRLPGGRKQRLAFRKGTNTVVEAVTYNKQGEKTATHTMREGKADKKRRGLRV